MKVSQVQPSDDGRLLNMQLSWGGHVIQLAGIYMPNIATSQKHFIQQRLGPLANTNRNVLQIWCGDFNFVENVDLDRRTRRVSDASERAVANTWRRLVPPSMVDIFRKRHPTTTSYSHFSAMGAARLDRFYISGSLEAFIASATIGEHVLHPGGAACSDHRPVFLELLPSTPLLATQRPPARARLHFTALPTLQRRFQEQVETLATTAPSDDHALLVWWPSFKRRLAKLCKSHNREAWALRRQRSTAAAEQLNNAVQRFEEGDDTALSSVLAIVPA